MIKEMRVVAGAQMFMTYYNRTRADNEPPMSFEEALAQVQQMQQQLRNDVEAVNE